MPPPSPAAPSGQSPLLTDEKARLAAVRRYNILDTPPDGAFDRITGLAARLFGVPIAIVSVVDTDRIWFKSHHGVDVNEIGRDPGLCASAIMQDEPWVVENADIDPRTLANPLVAGAFGLRFYAGVPLRTSDGYNLGTLCVIDREPRVVTPQELVDLSELAAIVMDEMELRVAARKVVSLETELRTRAEQLARMLQESLLPAELPSVPGLELAARYRPANRHRVGGDFYDLFPVADGWGVVVGDVCGHGPEAAAMTAMARHTLRALMLSGRAAAPAAALSELNRAMADRPISERRYCTVAVGKLQLVEAGAELTIALGGHPSPVRITADGDVESIGRRSPLVGWRPDACYVEANIRLQPGDTLVMYTDGLMDARHSAAPFDEVALRQLLRSCACGTAEATANELIAAIADDQQELRDDVAVLVIRVTR